MSTTINSTKQSVTSGLKRYEHPRTEGGGGDQSVSDSTANAGTDAVFLPALGPEAGSTGVPSESPNENCKTEKKTLASKVSSLIGVLPLSKLKIVIGTLNSVVRLPYHVVQLVVASACSIS